ncbi:hypothetical protein WJX74_005133 [Apatococcus lobatus]|uniref:Adenylyltransferase and sulfurtransferase MOCS3 n=1 Tax=Apatococcus lobatus TaxID=904363 RepID=A0AAW1RQK8_9CHLO
MDGSQDALVASLRAENQELIRRLASQDSAQQYRSDSTVPQAGLAWEGCGLTGSQVARYSRQLVLPSFGPQAQARLCKGSVLVIGAGGLGSPAVLYLAAGGVGRVGIVDTDALELSNLHRQIAHQEVSVGKHKAASAAVSCRALNSSIQVIAHEQGLLPGNALDLVSAYDVVLDCSDNAPTRYLASDACCIAAKPLVSGAALGMDGQLTTLCVAPAGPCYRCLYPQAPALASCRRCAEAGVLGVAPGIIGTLQALEAIKLLTGVGQPLTSRLLLLDCLSTGFRTIKLRHRQPACIACGPHATITASNLASYDYRAFTGQPFNDAAPPSISLIPAAQRLSVQDLASRMQPASTRPSNQLQPNQQPAAFSRPHVAEPEASNDSMIPISRLPSADFCASGCVAAETVPIGHQQANSCNPLPEGDEGQGAKGFDSASQPSGGVQSSAGPLLLDVRPKEQFAAAHLPGFVNVPYQGPHKPLPAFLLELCHPSQSVNQAPGVSSVLPSLSASEPDARIQNLELGLSQTPKPSDQCEAAGEILVVCRRGNDSQEVVQQLRSLGITGAMDIIGGLTAWSQSVDPSFPIY